MDVAVNITDLFGMTTAMLVPGDVCSFKVADSVAQRIHQPAVFSDGSSVHYYLRSHQGGVLSPSKTLFEMGTRSGDVLLLCADCGEQEENSRPPSRRDFVHNFASFLIPLEPPVNSRKRELCLISPDRADAVAGYLTERLTELGWGMQRAPATRCADLRILRKLFVATAVRIIDITAWSRGAVYSLQLLPKHCRDDEKLILVQERDWWLGPMAPDLDGWLVSSVGVVAEQIRPEPRSPADDFVLGRFTPERVLEYEPYRGGNRDVLEPFWLNVKHELASWLESQTRKESKK